MISRRKALAAAPAAVLALSGVMHGQAPQIQQTKGSSRRRVVPQEVIDRYKLRPAEGYGLFVIGVNGQPYDFDDVVAALFEMTRDHWQTRR